MPERAEWFPEALVRGFLTGVQVPLQGFVVLSSSCRGSTAIVMVGGRWFKVGVEEEASPLG